MPGQSRCWNAGADADPSNLRTTRFHPQDLPKLAILGSGLGRSLVLSQDSQAVGKKHLMRHCWHLVDVQLSYLLCLFGRCEVSEYISSNVLRSGTFRRCGAIKMLCAQCRGSHIAVMTLDSGHDLFFEPGRKQQMPKSVW